MGYHNYNDPFVLNTDASLQGLGTHPQSSRKKYHSGKLEIPKLKWAECEHFSDYLYYPPPLPQFTVYTDNNPLTCVLTTARLTRLVDFNFNIRYSQTRSRLYKTLNHFLITVL